MDKIRSKHAVKKYQSFAQHLNELLSPSDHRYSKITHREFAEKLGVTTQTIDKWCTAQKMPDHIYTIGKDDATIEGIVDLFNAEPYNRHISIQWLIGEDEYTNKKAKAACEYTGLNEYAVDAIRKLADCDESILLTLENILRTDSLEDFLYALYRYGENYDYAISLGGVHGSNITEPDLPKYKYLLQERLIHLQDELYPPERLPKKKIIKLTDYTPQNTPKSTNDKNSAVTHKGNK